MHKVKTNKLFLTEKYAVIIISFNEKDIKFGDLLESYVWNIIKKYNTKIKNNTINFYCILIMFYYRFPVDKIDYLLKEICLCL